MTLHQHVIHKAVSVQTVGLWYNMVDDQFCADLKDKYQAVLTHPELLLLSTFSHSVFNVPDLCVSDESLSLRLWVPF